MEYRLSEKWIKASIAGTLWAASEIVLGNFLHNLKVPEPLSQLFHMN